MVPSGESWLGGVWAGMIGAGRTDAHTHLGAHAGRRRELEEVQPALLGLHVVLDHEQAERRDEELREEAQVEAEGIISVQKGSVPLYLV